jgi:hypothetical protein
VREDARSSDADQEEVTMPLMRTSNPAMVTGRAPEGTFTALA